MSQKRTRVQGECELNLAAMLDMAFQLLTFFILTFKPSPVERSCGLEMPPPRPVTATPKESGTGQNEPLKPQYVGLNTLVISAWPSRSGDGSLGTISVGDVSVGNSLTAFDQRLQFVLTHESSPFEQVIIRAGSGLHYGDLMSILTTCKQQKLKNGDSLSRLSFVELPDRSS